MVLRLRSFSVLRLRESSLGAGALRLRLMRTFCMVSCESRRQHTQACGGEIDLQVVTLVEYGDGATAGLNWQAWRHRPDRGASTEVCSSHKQIIPDQKSTGTRSHHADLLATPNRRNWLIGAHS